MKTGIHDRRSYLHNLSSYELKAWIKSSSERDLNPFVNKCNAFRSLMFSYLSAQFKYLVFHYLYSLAFFIIYGCITNSQCGQLPVGLIAQLVEHCTGIAEVIGSNPVQPWIFFRPYFHNCLKCVNNYDDSLCVHIFHTIFHIFTSILE